MSVLIKGMKMPRSCYNCKLDLRTDVCSAFLEWEKEHPYTIKSNDRLSNCPLVEVSEPYNYGEMALSEQNVPSAQPNLQPTCNQLATDSISRQEAIDAIDTLKRNYPSSCFEDLCKAVDIAIKALSAQPEPLTDKEQRIFLAAMGREEKVCEEVDRNYVREPYEDSLMRVCKEIRRKVKGVLWT